MLPEAVSGSVVFDSLWPHGQAPLSTGSSRQEYWSGLPFPSPGDLPDRTWVSCTASSVFTIWATREAFLGGTVSQCLQTHLDWVGKSDYSGFIYEAHLVLTTKPLSGFFLKQHSDFPYTFLFISFNLFWIWKGRRGLYPHQGNQHFCQNSSNWKDLAWKVQR